MSLGAGSLDGLLRQERLLVARGCAEQGLAEDVADCGEEEAAECSADGGARWPGWTLLTLSGVAAWLLQLLLSSLLPALALPFSKAESCGLSELRARAAATGEAGCDRPVEESVPRG